MRIFILVPWYERRVEGSELGGGGGGYGGAASFGFGAGEDAGGVVEVGFGAGEVGGAVGGGDGGGVSDFEVGVVGVCGGLNQPWPAGPGDAGGLGSGLGHGAISLCAPVGAGGVGTILYPSTQPLICQASDLFSIYAILRAWANTSLSPN